MNLLKKALCFTIISLSFVLSSCSDKDLGFDAPDPEMSQSEGIYFSFQISVPVLGNSNTRARNNTDVEKFENYIDPAKLYIMFFLKDSTDKDKLYKMFGPTSHEYLTLIPVAYSNSDSYYKENWYVKIAVSEMPDGEQFADILRKNDFRIAVMANADLKDEKGDSRELKIKAAPVGTDGLVKKDENEHLILGDPIEMIHYQSSRANDPYASDLYGFIAANPPTDSPGYLGHYTDWVEDEYDDLMGINSVGIANTWIQEHTSPETGKTELLDDYNDLWFLWNFAGDATHSYIKYPVFNPEWKSRNVATEWEDRNGENLRTWLGTHGKELESFATGSVIIDGNNNKEVEGEENYLEYVEFYGNDKKATSVIKDFEGQKLYGINLPQAENAGLVESTYNKLNPLDGGYFVFKAVASGHLSITASGNTKIIAQIGKKLEHLEFSYNSTEPTTVTQEILVPGDSPYIYLFVDHSSQEAAKIYQIEYIQDTYLYESSRIGVAPTKEKPIPMYGIASYKRLENLWAVGTSFDLNDYNGTSPDINGATSTETYFHPVPLLRSVAKVIVRIPTSISAKDVFLRNVNRYARWEPSDIITDTSDIWYDDHEDWNPNVSYPEDQHNRSCEFFNIVSQGPFYDKDATGTQTQAYQQKLAWYYGNWAKDGTLGGFTPEVTVQNNGGVFTYPHIINPVIHRSDYVRFIYAGTEEIYDKYVLYVPEKYVDDPTNPDDENILNSAPSVCHIEFRHQDDEDGNLDDNNCYRIYFTNKGFYDANGTQEPPDLRDENHSWEVQYEQNKENLKHHWPILRNHTYQFTVDDINSQLVIVRLEVLPWKKVPDIEVSW